MLRFRVEVLGCDWVDDATTERCIEVRFCRRGARCRVNSTPTEMVIRSSPETEHLYIVALHEETIIGSSDAVEIGGITRRVGARMVEVRSTDAGAARLCVVHIMWSSEEEDWTVFFRQVEDYERNIQPIAAGTLTTEAPQNPPYVKHAVPPLTENNAQWCVGSPQYAPKGMLNYFVTSTQSVDVPNAWRNLYTSPCPLLVVHKEQLSKINETLPAGSAAESPTQPVLDGFGSDSALEDICLNPTKPVDLTGDYLRRERYRSRVNVPWRKGISTVKANPSHSTIG
ncbi:hypothetical protein, conserved [Trypanosoma brucei gambiense DAL972]|uniref:Uncharacterized protein n=1 Tax=Trypanosoma brucei gambiense (strain MHOM/CI/86/DAL972) TaxID=679716 RepID=D0AA73_TRYB9|nr:hypothetical protein, conserved [Trypanosoma brucei gambiense DAL972]CBH18574.1 hypothetical protein, conserved [Trypanosoma brucei gambiense DAL972]|eukprot:XP_011780838.1 hypothetical protein, conserved [Trypanosoma brucei gambiense DAL972]